MTLGERYREEMGHDAPELAEDDPLRWQYDYRGTRAEKERLQNELEWLKPETPVVLPGQEALL